MGLNQEHSGYHSWLLETIRANCAGGEELVAASKKFKSREQYAWLLDQLLDRGETEIIESYRKRRRDEVNERTLRLKRLQLAGLDERIASRLKAGLREDSYSLDLQKTADKLRKAIEKHDALQQGEAKDDRTEQ